MVSVFLLGTGTAEAFARADSYLTRAGFNVVNLYDVNVSALDDAAAFFKPFIIQCEIIALVDEAPDWFLTAPYYNEYSPKIKHYATINN